MALSFYLNILIMAKRRRKKRLSFSKIVKTAFLSIAFIFIVVGALYGIITTNKTNAESVSQEMVLERLGEQLVLPSEEPLNVVRVSNAKELKEQDEFYEAIKNGDYIIVYDNLSLIYNFDQKLIKKIKTR